MPCSEDVLSHLADTMARESDGLLALESCTPVSVSTEAKMKLRYLLMVFRLFDDNERGYSALSRMVEFLVVSRMVHDPSYSLL